jgi:hypothetical protein
MPRRALTIPTGLAAVAVSLAACGGGSHPAATPKANPTSATGAPTTPAAAPRPTCPLTGLVPTKSQNRRRPALAVKIDNVAPAMPQAGLNQADLVFEETVEGGLTRLMAVFQCDGTSSIGPIRSTRVSDADMLRLFNGAVFGFSGANPNALRPVAALSKAVLISMDALPQYYHRDYSRPAPHNVFSSSQTILSAGIARRKSLHAPPQLFRYGAMAHNGLPAHGVSVTWPSASAGWTWTGHRYVRIQNGSADRLVNGKQVDATNVIVMSIHVDYNGLHDVLGNASPEDITVGSGKVWVFRDGRVIRGTWHRANRGKTFTLTDKLGSLLRLHPGRTWIELLPVPGSPHITP